MGFQVPAGFCREQTPFRLPAPVDHHGNGLKQVISAADGLLLQKDLHFSDGIPCRGGAGCDDYVLCTGRLGYVLSSLRVATPFDKHCHINALTASACLGGAFMLLWGYHSALISVRLVLVCLCCSASFVMAAEPDEAEDPMHDPGLAGQVSTDPIQVEVLDDGTSSRRQRRASSKELPLNRLSRVNRVVVEGVLDDISLFRRLPVIRCEVDQVVMQLFTKHPDAAVSIWRAMGISDMQLTRLNGGQFRTDSGDGTHGVITVIHDAPDQKLIVCDGLFKGPMISKPIKARALMHLRTKYAQDRDGRTFATCTADVFVSFPSTAVETVARVISPVTYRIADQNFKEVGMFLRMMQIAMDKQPQWVEQIAAQLQGIPVSTQKELLATVSAVTSTSPQSRKTAQKTRFAPEDLRLPAPARESEGTALKTATIEGTSTSQE